MMIILLVALSIACQYVVVYGYNSIGDFPQGYPSCISLPSGYVKTENIGAICVNTTKTTKTTYYTEQAISKGIFIDRFGIRTSHTAYTAAFPICRSLPSGYVRTGYLKTYCVNTTSKPSQHEYISQGISTNDKSPGTHIEVCNTKVPNGWIEDHSPIIRIAVYTPFAPFCGSNTRAFNTIGFFHIWKYEGLRDGTKLDVADIPNKYIAHGLITTAITSESDQLLHPTIYGSDHYNFGRFYDHFRTLTILRCFPPGHEIEICDDVDNPPGYASVVVQQFRCGKYYGRRLIRVQGLDIGTTKVFCDTKVPPGWIELNRHSECARYNNKIFYSITAQKVADEHLPWICPTISPTRYPISQPSIMPSIVSTRLPTTVPSELPIPQPSIMPSIVSTRLPTTVPSELPSAIPSPIPNTLPTPSPSSTSTVILTTELTVQPTIAPSPVLSGAPNSAPPSTLQTTRPTVRLTNPTEEPSIESTIASSILSTQSSTAMSSMNPTEIPSIESTIVSSVLSTQSSTAMSSMNPTEVPSMEPTVVSSILSTQTPSAMSSKNQRYLCNRSVAVLADSRYFEMSGTSNLITALFFEVRRLQILFFHEDGDIAAFLSEDSISVLIIPEAETESLLNGLSVTDKVALQSFVQEGNIMIVLGANRFNQGHDVEFMNTLFGYNLRHFGNGLTCERAANNKARRIENVSSIPSFDTIAPEFLLYRNTIYCLDPDSFPIEGKSLYSAVYGGSSWIAQFPYGEGFTYFFGHDFYERIKNDEEWINLLLLVIRSSPSCVVSQPFPWPTTLPTTQPSVFPSDQPSSYPTAEPSVQPSSIPTSRPSSKPTSFPTLSNRPNFTPLSMYLSGISYNDLLSNKNIQVALVTATEMSFNVPFSEVTIINIVEMNQEIKQRFILRLANIGIKQSLQTIVELNASFVPPPDSLIPQQSKADILASIRSAKRNMILAVSTGQFQQTLKALVEKNFVEPSVIDQLTNITVNFSTVGNDANEPGNDRSDDNNSGTIDPTSDFTSKRQRETTVVQLTIIIPVCIVGTILVLLFLWLKYRRMKNGGVENNDKKGVVKNGPNDNGEEAVKKDNDNTAVSV